VIGGSKQAGGDKAARKQPKKLMHETKPSPMGRRVQPIVDAALRAKVEAAAAKKRKDQVCIVFCLAYCTMIVIDELFVTRN
jgi:hypothetical protein